MANQVQNDGEETTWDRLGRRKVVQWAVAYLAGAWGLLQGIQFLTQTFDWPGQMLRLATVAFAGGLPVVVALAWYHGDRGEQRVSRSELAIVTLLFLLGGGFFWRYQHASETASVVTPPPASAPAALAADDHSIAVLPFVNMSSDKEQDYFSDGLSEELLNLLTQVPQLRVIARTSSFSFKGKEIDVADIAKRLNVAHVLEGSVRKSGNTLRITAQLIRASDSSHLWSQTFDRELTDVFKIQDEIAAAVVSELKIKLLSSQQVINTHRAASADAYSLYLLGNHFHNRGTGDDYRRAVAAYQRAIALDPGYAAAWAGLSIAEFMAADSLVTTTEIAAGRHRALAAAEKAIALAPNLADGYSARGLIRSNVDWDWVGARADIEKALSLDAGSGLVQRRHGHLQAVLGHLPEAIAATRKATDLDPLSTSSWSNLGLFLIGDGQWPEARQAVDRLLAISPESELGNDLLGQLELLQGRPREALLAYRRAGEVFGQTGVAMAEHALRREKESQQALDELITKYAHDAAYQIAEVYAWRGEPDKAFEWLERAHAQRDGGLVDIKFDPLLKPLHGDPRFAAMVGKMGLPP